MRVLFFVFSQLFWVFSGLVATVTLLPLVTGTGRLDFKDILLLLWFGLTAFSLARKRKWLLPLFLVPTLYWWAVAGLCVIADALVGAIRFVPGYYSWLTISLALPALIVVLIVVGLRNRI